MSKSPDAFRTISEVADDLDLPQHVLRFWETRFNQIKPMKRGGGRRYYRPDDVDLLRGIKTLLYSEGYTIRGAQRLLKEQGVKFAIQVGQGQDPVAILGSGAEPAAPEEAGTGREAVSVSELDSVIEGSGKGSTILKRLTGRGGNDDSGQDITISAEDRKNLQATLFELLECKRLLDQTR